MTTGNDQYTNSAEAPASDQVQPADELVAVQAETRAALKAVRARAKAIDKQASQVEESLAVATAAKTALDASREAANGSAAEVAALVEQGQAALASLEETKASARSATEEVDAARNEIRSSLEAIRAARTETTEIASALQGHKAEAEESALAVAAKSQNIEDGRIHADAVRCELDAHLEKVKAAAGAAASEYDSVRTAAEHVTSLQATVQGTKATIDTISEAVSGVRAQCESHMQATRRLADAAESMEAGIATNTAELIRMQSAAAEHLKTIEAMLLGATNAGLAHAFDARSKTFRRPGFAWQLTFIASLAALLVLAILMAHSYKGGEIPHYEELARMLLHRLPFVVPLVWLAIHAARQASFAKRMEEGYAFKATVSTSFEGYRRQLAEISGDVPNGSPLAQLCSTTLNIIASPPGQVYDKNRMDPTPASAVAELMAPFAPALSGPSARRAPKAAAAE